ncbi:MAG: hypothetical protein D3914_02460 [Candidatus Electrothrix sp. LOE2]|nr:hypothetical protein [Candidatus Electrothrix sp. LOE2]
MEKGNEKGKVAEKGASGIKEGRLKILKNNYQQPKIIEFRPNSEINDKCSDMASSCGFTNYC